jgi:hypothetical protein
MEAAGIIFIFLLMIIIGIASYGIYDASTSEWKTGEWSKCSKECGGGILSQINTVSGTWTEVVNYTGAGICTCFRNGFNSLE